MKFIRQSLIWRLFLYFSLFAAVIVVSVYYFLSVDKETIPLKIFAGGLGVFLLLYLFSVFYMVVRPIRVIQKQMKALLTGRPYKKAFTTRIDEIGVLAYFFNKVTDTLSKVSGTVKEGKRMASELDVASQLQRDILPEKPPLVPGLEIAAKTRSAVEVGGDNFDFVTYDNGSKTLLYLGDVTGHGVPAALVMTMVHTLISIFSEMKNNIYDILVNVNTQLKKRIRATMFMTMVMLSWDHVSQKMTYLGAGHEYILIYRAATGEIESIQSGGIALGMVPDNSKIIKEESIDLGVGDVIVLYTDGIVEAKNEKGEMFGLDRLKQVAAKYAAQYAPEGLCYHIAMDFSQFAGKTVQADDISLLAVKYVGAGKEKVSESTIFGEGGKV